MPVFNLRFLRGCHKVSKGPRIASQSPLHSFMCICRVENGNETSEQGILVGSVLVNSLARSSLQYMNSDLCNLVILFMQVLHNV